MVRSWYGIFYTRLYFGMVWILALLTMDFTKSKTYIGYGFGLDFGFGFGFGLGFDFGTARIALRVVSYL